MSYLIVLAIGALIPKIWKNLKEKNKGVVYEKQYLNNYDNNNYYDTEKQYQLQNTVYEKRKVEYEKVTQQIFVDEYGTKTYVETTEFKRPKKEKNINEYEFER